MAGKTVLITGASYGIGECLAESLADTGAHLLLVARTPEKLLEVKQLSRQTRQKIVARAVAKASHAFADGIGMPSYGNLDLLRLAT